MFTPFYCPLLFYRHLQEKHEDELSPELLDIMRDMMIAEGGYYDEENEIGNRPWYIRFLSNFFEPDLPFILISIGFMLMLIPYSLFFCK